MNLDTGNLKNSIDQILTCGDDFGLMIQAVDDLYRIYNTFIDELKCDKDVLLPSGKDISTSVTAHCSLEMKRTSEFLRGIHEAIDYKVKQQKNTPIHILYARNWPYATLVAPLLLLFNHSEINVDLLVINPVSLNSAIKVLNNLGLEQFIGSVYLVNADVFQVDKNYDVVISETMLAAFKKLQQVAIMQNLISQYSKNVVFIPQEITVKTEFISTGKWNNATFMFDLVYRIELGEIIWVNNEKPNSNECKTVLPIPIYREDCETLFLNTPITVYGNHQAIAHLRCH